MRSVRTTLTAPAPSVLILTIVLLLASCSQAPPASSGGGTTQVDATPAADDDLRGAVAGLCLALERLATHPARARDAFYDLAHERLHAIAAAVGAEDREAATSLLEAKSAVEADLEAMPPPPPSLEGDLKRLVATTRSALQALSIPSDPC